MVSRCKSERIRIVGNDEFEFVSESLARSYDSNLEAKAKEARR